MSQHTHGKLKIMTLTVKRSAKGTEYLSGYLNNLSVIAFKGEPTEWGETWDVFVQERQPKGQQAGKFQRQDQRSDQRRDLDMERAAVDMFNRPLDRDSD
jgi:hypothetical protein